MEGAEGKKKNCINVRTRTDALWCAAGQSGKKGIKQGNVYNNCPAMNTIVFRFVLANSVHHTGTSLPTTVSAETGMYTCLPRQRMSRGCDNNGVLLTLKWVYRRKQVKPPVNLNSNTLTWRCCSNIQRSIINSKRIKKCIYIEYS